MSETQPSQETVLLAKELEKRANLVKKVEGRHSFARGPWGIVVLVLAMSSVFVLPGDLPAPPSFVTILMVVALFVCIVEIVQLRSRFDALMTLLDADSLDHRVVPWAQHKSRVPPSTS